MDKAMTDLNTQLEYLATEVLRWEYKPGIAGEKFCWWGDGTGWRKLSELITGDGMLEVIEAMCADWEMVIEEGYVVTFNKPPVFEDPPQDGKGWEWCPPEPIPSLPEAVARAAYRALKGEGGG